MTPLKDDDVLYCFRELPAEQPNWQYHMKIAGKIALSESIHLQRTLTKGKKNLPQTCSPRCLDSEHK